MSSTVSQSLFPIRVDGNEYFMDLPQWETDYIQSNLAKSSSPYELEMLQAMKSVLMEGDLVLDVYRKPHFLPGKNCRLSSYCF